MHRLSGCLGVMLGWEKKTNDGKWTFGLSPPQLVLTTKKKEKSPHLRDSLFVSLFSVMSHSKSTVVSLFAVTSLDYIFRTPLAQAPFGSRVR